MSYANRRHFLRQFAAFAGVASVTPFFQTAQGQDLMRSLERLQDVDPADTVTDETFWYQVKQAYTVNPNIINLNNGGVSPSPKVVQEAVERYNRLSNETPSYYMWRTLDEGREGLRRKLSEIAGCSPEELAIDRNSSEALETIIFGLRLKAGDEVVLTKQDYPNMINAWKQREKRDGVVLKWISLDVPTENKSYLVNSFVNAFSAKTKVVHVTHMINWNGQKLPVKEIAQEAHKRGIEVLVDGAHTFAHFPFNIPNDLGCDYYGASLHKWLCAPFGSGMLYVKKDKIKNLYPLLAAPDPESEDIRKFEHLGTRSFAIEEAIGVAVDFHHMIGSERKAQRLHYLKNYWVERVTDLPNVHVRTPLSPDWSGAIGLLDIDGKKPGDVGNALFNKYRIHCTSIEWENIRGARLTPNVYTTTRDLDVLIAAIRELAKS